MAGTTRKTAAGLVAVTLSLGAQAASAGSEPRAGTAAPIGSGAGSSSGAGYLVESWRTDQGLPSDLVVGVAQTLDGYLWVATNAGLARFDGVRFRVFEPGNTPALRSEQCAPIFVDREGALWIPTMGGSVTRLHDGRFTTLEKADGIAFDYVFNFVQGSGRKVWLGTNAGLHLWDGARFHAIGPDQGLPLLRASPLWEDAAGWLWVCGADGMVGRYREGTFVPHGKTGHPLLDRLPEPLRPWPGPDGSVWTVLDSGRRIAHMRGDELEVLDPRPVSPGDRVGRLLETRSGDLWLGMSESGLRVVHRGVMTALGESEQIPRAPINALFEDREGNVWVGTSAGILRIRPRLFSMLDDRAGITDPRSWAVLEDRRGDIWIGTESFLYRLRGGRATQFTAREGLGGPGVLSLAEDRDGNLWAGTTGGLARLEGDRFVNFTVKDGLSSNNVRSLYADREGRLWIGTQTGGLNLYEAGRFRSWTAKEGLGSNWVRFIHEDAAGDLWVATTGGLGRLRQGSWRNFTSADGLAGDSVIAIHEDEEGALWIGSFGGGLSRIKEGKIAALTEADGLPSNTIPRILPDDRGNLWFSSPKGIFRVNRRILDAVVEGRARTVQPVVYGKGDGMSTTDCGGGTQPAGWRARDGRLLFPTSRGVAVVDPAAVPENRVPPPVVIEELVHDGTHASPAGGQVLPAGTRSVEIHYAGLSFTAPDRVRFRFRLEGLDPAWTEAGGRRTAYFTHLPPGSYRFRVSAANNDGVWNESGASLEFTIRPFFYQTAWFYAACAALAAAAAYGVYRLRTRQIEARYAAILAERSRIARELHDTIAQGFAGVSMQLEAVSAHMDGSPEQARESLDRARLQVRSSLADARRTVRDLRPHLLETGDLAASLRSVAAQLVSGTGLHAEVKVHGARHPVPQAVEDQLFRVGQEALTNAIKHAGCRSLKVELHYRGRGLALTVADDGRGFSPGAARPSADSGGFGILGMRERMAQIDGTLDVESAPGRGTRIVARWEPGDWPPADGERSQGDGR